MAEQTQTQDQAAATESNGGNGTNGGHKTAVRAAAIAAATGAAALAARKAFSGKDQSDEGKEKSGSSRSSGGNESTLLAMATSGLGAAKDSLLPFAEEAAGAAGEWVGRNGPDYVCDSIVPRFISGFERGRKSSEQQD
jgi:hypothetical protein